MNKLWLLLLLVIPYQSITAQEANHTLMPSLKETLDWMHSAFSDSESVTAVRFGQTRELNYVDGKDGVPPSCTITVVDHWKTDGKSLTRDTIVDLSLIDPNSIQSYQDNTVLKGEGVLTFVATNDKRVIVEKTEVGGKSNTFQSKRQFISFIGLEYATRFAKAFKNAVTLCGGKPSMF